MSPLLVVVFVTVLGGSEFVIIAEAPSVAADYKAVNVYDEEEMTESLHEQWQEMFSALMLEGKHEVDSSKPAYIYVNQESGKIIGCAFYDGNHRTTSGTYFFYLHFLGTTEEHHFEFAPSHQAKFLRKMADQLTMFEHMNLDDESEPPRMGIGVAVKEESSHSGYCLGCSFREISTKYDIIKEAANAHDWKLTAHYWKPHPDAPEKVIVILHR